MDTVFELYVCLPKIDTSPEVWCARFTDRVPKHTFRTKYIKILDFEKSDKQSSNFTFGLKTFLESPR